MDVFHRMTICFVLASAFLEASAQPTDLKTYLLDSKALIETRQVYLDYLAVPEAEREPFTPPSSSPADYAYDRKRATVAAVSQLMINAEIRMDSYATSPLAIIYKTRLPESGDIHDYYSLARYFWPREKAPCLVDPAFVQLKNLWLQKVNETAWELTESQRNRMPQEIAKVLEDGGAWVNCDGLTNPDLFKGGSMYINDRDIRLILMRTVQTLSLAYWYTGNETYAERVRTHLYNFYINPDTRMNPNLNHAQAVPGFQPGRPEGIVDWVDIVHFILDPVQLLLAAGTPHWRADDQSKLIQWFTQFLEWLKVNPLAIAEREQVNNHGGWYRQIAAGIAMHVGDSAFAHTLFEELARDYVGGVMSPAGYLPFDALRTRSWHYNIYGLLSWARTTQIEASSGGNTIVTHVGPEGQSFRRGVEWLLPYATGRAIYPFYDLNEDTWIDSDALELYWYAAAALKDKEMWSQMKYIIGFNATLFESSTIQLYMPMP